MVGLSSFLRMGVKENSMNFGKAVENLKLGERVARAGWNGKGMYIYLTIFDNFEPCITMHTAQGTEQPGWLASQADIFAEDWSIL